MPAPEENKMKLADELPEDSAIRAKLMDGFYNEWSGDLATPLMQLAEDLDKEGHAELSARVKSGDFDDDEPETEDDDDDVA